MRNATKPNPVGHHLLPSLRAAPAELGVQGRVPEHLRFVQWGVQAMGGMEVLTPGDPGTAEEYLLGDSLSESLRHALGCAL